MYSLVAILGIVPVFYKLLYMSITASLIGFVILFIRKFADKKITPTWKIAMWLCVVFALAVPFRVPSNTSLVSKIEPIQNVSYLYEYRRSDQAYKLLIKQNEPNESVIIEAKEQMTQLKQKALIFDVVIPLVWFFGFLVLSLYIVVGRIFLSRKLAKHSQLSNPDRYNAILDSCKAKLGISKDFKIMIQRYLTTPALMGLFSPTIILPSYIGEMEDTQVEYIILHELGHYKRFDMLLNYVLLILQAVYWFNPITWILFKFIRQDLELANDAFVLDKIGEGNQKAYSLSLVEVLGRTNGIPLAPKLLCMVDNKNNMERRISMIKLGKVFRKNRILFAVLAVVIICVISALFLTSNNDSENENELVTLSEKPLSTAVPSMEHTIHVMSYQPEDSAPFGVDTVTIIDNHLPIGSAVALLDKTKGFDVNANLGHFDAKLFFTKGDRPKEILVTTREGGTPYVLSQVDLSDTTDDIINIPETDGVYDFYIWLKWSETDSRAMLFRANVHVEEENAVTNYDYNKVQIEFLSNMTDFKENPSFETEDLAVVADINDTIKSTKPHEGSSPELENNNIAQFRIELSNSSGGYSCILYYDSLYDKAYVIRDGDTFDIGTDFARYIDSLLGHPKLNLNMEQTAVDLFKQYSWTLDYKINGLTEKIEKLDVLSGFNPNAFYFAYNNEFSKDIGLDMSKYVGEELNVDIYRLRESMPKEFYPIQDARGIVVKSGDKIIGAYISAGRHSAFSACSLKGNSFETITNGTFGNWIENLAKSVKSTDQLAKLTPQELIHKYFDALDKGSAEQAIACMAKQNLVQYLTVNMPDEYLYNDAIPILLTDADFNDKPIDNIKSAKVLAIKELENASWGGPTPNAKYFRINMDLQYAKERTISSGNQQWDCKMVYESPETGWKILEFGH